MVKDFCENVFSTILNYVGTERTMVLKSQGWRYNKKGFEEVFLPLSETCNDPNGKTIK